MVVAGLSAKGTLDDGAECADGSQLPRLGGGKIYEGQGTRLLSVPRTPIVEVRQSGQAVWSSITCRRSAHPGGVGANWKGKRHRHLRCDGMLLTGAFAGYAHASRVSIGLNIVDSLGGILGGRWTVDGTCPIYSTHTPEITDAKVGV